MPPEFAAFLSAVTNDLVWDELPDTIQEAAQPFLPTWDDVRGILADRPAALLATPVSDDTEGAG